MRKSTATAENTTIESDTDSQIDPANSSYDGLDYTPLMVVAVLETMRDRVFQKARISTTHRISAIERGSSKASPETETIFRGWLDRFQELESEITDQAIEACKGIPIVEDMVALRGISYVTAAKILSKINITQANTIAALWRYAGYGIGEYWVNNETGKVAGPVFGYRFVKQGEIKVREFAAFDADEASMHIEKRRDQLLEGWVSPFNRRLKTALFTAADSLIKARSPYTAIYYETKEAKLQAGIPRGHAHMQAIRKMNKILLSHIWMQWREREGLPVRAPYAQEKLGHTTILERSTFGWPAIEAR